MTEQKRPSAERYQLTWRGERHPFRPGWTLSCLFRIANGVHGGYDNRCEAFIDDREYESFPGIVCVMLHEMVKQVREAAYDALCNNRDVFSLGAAWEAARKADQRANAAEARANEIQEKAGKMLRIMRELGGES